MSLLYSSSNEPASNDLPAWMYSPRDAPPEGSQPPPPPPPLHPSSSNQDVLFEQQERDRQDQTAQPSWATTAAPTSTGSVVNTNGVVRTERDPLLGASGLSPSTGNSSLLRRDFFTFRSQRSATDKCFLLLFVVYWLGMIALGVYSLTRDNNVDFAKYITGGIDFQGKTCDQFVFFPDFQTNPDFGFCIDKCPNTTGNVLTTILPVETRQPAISGERNGVNITTSMEPVQFLSYKSHPWTYVCKPANVDSEATMVAQLQDTIGRFVGALSGSWRVLLLGCCISLGCSFVYLTSLRYCGCVSLFFSIMGIEGILVYGSYRLLGASMDPLAYVDDPAMKNTLQIAAVIMSCGAVLFLAMALLSLRRLLLAGTFINHASRALSQLKQLLLVPFLVFVLLFVLFGWGVFITICIFGAGRTSTRIATIAAYAPSSVDVRVETFTVDWRLRWFFLYHLWGMYWSVSMVLSIGEMVTACAVSTWYFAKENSITNEKQMAYLHPVSHAMTTTLRYHLGTLAFSSATVAIVCHVRNFFLYVEEQNELESSSLTHFVATCCCCCIWCFNYCLKYICKESVYITAIQGTSFNPSSKLAYTLISSNLLRVGALDRIGNAAVFLGKLIICATTCFVCWFFLGNNVSSPVLPLLAIMLFSYSVAHAFMTIYETTINMLLMCFTLDENMHGGRGNAMFAPGTLIRSVNDHLRPKWQTVL